jgi:hypothetical protein
LSNQNRKLNFEKRDILRKSEKGKIEGSLQCREEINRKCVTKVISPLTLVKGQLREK